MSDTSMLPPPPEVGQEPEPADPSGPGRHIRPLILIPLVVLAVAVSAIAIASRGNDGSTADAGNIGTPTPSLIIRPPVRLRAKPAAFRVVLAWGIGAGDVQATSYGIYRDGSFIATMGAADRRYVDSGVMPDVEYAYRIDAVLSGNRSSGATVTTKTPNGPLSAARLTGVFNVRFLRTSVYGVNGIPEKTTGGWRFTPKCGDGACDATWKDIHWQQLSAILKREGAAYTGSDTVHGLLECSGSPSTSSYRVTLHVTHAATLRDAWRATAFSGTVTTYDSPQLGCRSSGITYSIKGTLVR